MSNVIGVSRWRLYLAAVVLAVGLSTAPPLLEQAAAGTVVTICNSAASWNNVYGDFRVIDSARGYSFWLSDGECVTVANTTTLRADRFGTTTPNRWKVRSVPGEYGAWHWDPESNPGSLAKYSYLVGG